jgi:hypothetical protein
MSDTGRKQTQLFLAKPFRRVRFLPPEIVAKAECVVLVLERFNRMGEAHLIAFVELGLANLLGR